MIYLEFDVDHQFINRIDIEKPMTDSKNYIFARFNFLSDDWNLMNQITALFTKDDESFIMLLNENGECKVPWELLVDSGDLYVSVYSGNLSTTNKSRVTIYEGGYTEDTENSEPPTSNIYTQILDNVGNIQSEVADLKENLLIIDGGTIEDWQKE